MSIYPDGAMVPEAGWSSAIVEAWDGLIYVGGPDYRIRFMSRRFIETLGRDATGELCYQALHGRDEPCPWCSAEVFAGTKNSSLFQHPVDGLWYHVSNVPLPLADGSFAKAAFIREAEDSEAQIKNLPVYRNIVDRLGDLICFHDPEDGSLRYVNDLTCSSLGYQREFLLGMHPAEFADWPQPLRHWQNLIERIDQQGTAVFEARLRRRDGSSFDVEIKANLLQAGLHPLVVTVARDISERKRAEARLIEERNKVEAIMAAMGDGITVIDRNYRVIYHNDVLIRRRGHHLGEFCYRIYANRDQICDDCQARESFTDGKVHCHPFDTTAPDGGPLYLEITSSPLLDASGEVIACVEVVRDITERRRLEHSREEAFSAVSHEMRTPLTAIIGFTQYLLENPISVERQREYLQMIDKESERLKRLIDNLLSLQRLRAGFGLNNPAPVSPYPLLLELAEQYRTPLVKQHIEIDCSIDFPPVWADSDKLREALSNLLDNAIKYSPTAGTIILGANRDGNAANLWVRDQGSGIPEQEQKKIFKRFYRLETRNGPPGTGLGLALVKEIAQAHGGRVTVQSRSGEATTFLLQIPLAP